MLAMTVAGFAQVVTTQKSEKKPVPAAVPTPLPTPVDKGPVKITTPEQVAELVIFFYGRGGGRATLNQIRKTTQEKGKTTTTAADGHKEMSTYQRLIIRGDALNKEKILLDQEFPGARYSLVYKEGKIYGIYNNAVFTPRQDASLAFENQIVHGIEALLRYKENESKLELGEREKIMGVDYYVVDVTDKQDRKTRFFISAKSYRIMMLTYEDSGIKYRRKYYDYNYAQGTLVPFRSVLWANDKIIEEADVLTVTFGQKIDDDIFKAS